MAEEENKVEEADEVKKPTKKAKKVVVAEESEEVEEADEAEETSEDTTSAGVPKNLPVQRITVRLSGKEYYMPVFFLQETAEGLAIYGPQGQLCQAPVKHADPKTERELRAKLARNVARFNQQQRSAVHPTELQPVPQIRAR